MTPAQKAAARTAHTEAVASLDEHSGGWVHHADAYTLLTIAEAFMHHTEVLAGHLAVALTPDPFVGLTGPEAVGADPTASTPPEGPTP